METEILAASSPVHAGTASFENPTKEPAQLDLFIPYQYGHELKVVLTNKTLGAAKVVAFHSGRGSQEGVFAELKTHSLMDYVPTRTSRGNQVGSVANSTKTQTGGWAR